MQFESSEQETGCSLVELNKNSSYSEKNLTFTPFTSNMSLQLTSLETEFTCPLFKVIVSERWRILH